MQILREYELMIILDPNLNEETLAPTVERVNGFITRLGGVVSESNQAAPWGKRRMQYPINNNTEGIYILSTIQLDPKNTVALERDLEIADAVMRHMLLLKDK